MQVQEPDSLWFLQVVFTECGIDVFLKDTSKIENTFKIKSQWLFFVVKKAVKAGWGGEWGGISHFASDFQVGRYFQAQSQIHRIFQRSKMRRTAFLW